MKLEKIIKSISSFVAMVVIFLMAGGMYLSFKGFEMLDDGSIVLMNQAYAQDVVKELPVIPDNYVFPDKHSEGAADAPITLYEYSSFGCSHCADFHLGTLPQLKEKYVKEGKLRLVFVPFPIDKSSMDAALLGECMPEDKYMAFVDLMFKKQREWGLSRNPEKVLKQYAALSGLSNAKADACLHDDDVARDILFNRQNGITQLGIEGTPSFVISYKGKSEMLGGAMTFENISNIIDNKLNN
ncbi:MAG: DsbA family protein [Alphaproteobacteria bacterium]|nr:DsbA family protein [Alphaproteobacteria bacterium]